MATDDFCVSQGTADEFKIITDSLSLVRTVEDLGDSVRSHHCPPDDSRLFSLLASLPQLHTFVSDYYWIQILWVNNRVSTAYGTNGDVVKASKFLVPLLK